MIITHSVGGTLLQEVKVRASVPSGQSVADYASLQVRLEYSPPPPATEQWQQAWKFESTEAISDAPSSAEAVVGATGLVPGALNRVRVAFCRQAGSLKGCHCWSEPTLFDTNGDGTADVVPVDYPTYGPSPPAAFTQLVEDQFRRPASSSKGNDGNGLGMGKAWSDAIGTAGNQPYISAASSCGTTDPDIFDCAETPADLIPHNQVFGLSDTYGEIRFRPKSDFAQTADIRFNYALNGRYTSAGNKFFQVKYVTGYVNACQPTLLIMNNVEFDRFPTAQSSCMSCAQYAVVLGIPAGEQGTFCLQFPQSSLPLNQFMWLRSEIVDNTDREPVVKATVAWGCTDGQSISSCTSSYATTRINENDPAELSEVEGQWVLEAHDLIHLVDIFRAGSIVP